MNYHLIKKTFLITASFFWMVSPFTAAIADNSVVMTDQVIIAEASESAPPEPQFSVISTSEHVMTAYTSEVAQTDSTPCITANGFNLCKSAAEDTIAANFLKFGTKVRIPELFGDRVFVVRDRMNKRYPNRVDVWFKNKTQAIHFGVQTARIEVVTENSQID
jgi:3D (Asp-Asp-Asp) domain-containing protein